MALPSMDPQGTVDTNVPTLNADETRVDLNGLSPNTNYSVTLRACTAVGCGSSTTVISPTNEDGERTQFPLLLVIYHTHIHTQPQCLSQIL